MAVTVSTTAMATANEIVFKEGHVKDEWAQIMEPIQRKVEGRAFLWTGRKAEVGQRTETQVTTADGGWCRLSGVVTDVGPMPSLSEWRDGDSCQLPSGVKSNTLPVDRQMQLRDETIQHFGTLHGQVVTSYSLLNFDFYDRQEELPFKRARIYKVTHVADENKSFVWCVRKIEDVTDMPYDAVFRKWQEGSRVARAVSF